MNINFCIRGRLGNAIFRYMAATIMCLYYNGKYVINHRQQHNCSDELFLNIINHVLQLFSH